MKPQKGQWYRHRDLGRDFRIVGVDEGEGVVGMQYADGDESGFERLPERESGGPLSRSVKDA